MAIQFNLGSVTEVQFNNNPCNEVWFNGTQVFSSVQQTTIPDITYTYDPVRTRYTIRVYNRDSSGAASIWSEVNDSTPDVLRSSSVAYNSYTQWLYTSGFPGFTIYATAQVSGETLSPVRSVYVS